MAELNYKPDGETLRTYIRDLSYFTAIQGPVGSGKSVASCIKIMMLASQQQPDAEGTRRSRWAVIRNTNPQLKTTTIKTWQEWFPEEKWGKFNWSPPYTHHIKVGDIDAEIIFLALDRPDDVKKLLSLELTGAWINEAREIPKSIVDAVTMRLGRFPPMKDGGPSWFGMFCDTNPPPEDHWWPIMSGAAPIPEWISHEEALTLQAPPDWTFYNQPSGMTETKDAEGIVTAYELNPDAENANFHVKGYYEKMIQGKTKSWIDVYVMNRMGTLIEGKPVYNQFKRDTHVAKEPLNVLAADVYVGIDFGLTPAAVFAQKHHGRWNVVQELVAVDMGMVRFSALLHEVMGELSEKAKSPLNFKLYGDPAGDQRAQTDETTPFEILRRHKIKAYPTSTNDVALRIEAVNAPLTRMTEGRSGVLIDPGCKVLVAGFEGGYHYRRLQVTGERFSDSPDKNRFSHVHDAFQYLMLGGGEGRALTMGGEPQKPVNARGSYDVFRRRSTQRTTSGIFGRKQ